MATYVRQSSFSDGDTITSALFNNEFNQLVNAFNVSSGHTHDGSTTGDGGPISNLFSNALVFGTNANTDIAITFNATTNDGVLTWMEDEDYFKFSDDLLIDSTEKVQFRDTGLYIYSSADGQLDIVADTEVQIAATTIDINGNADISGNLGIGGNLTVTGTTTFNGGTLTLGDSAADNVVFGADVDSNIIPDDDGAYDLGSSTQEWRDLYIDGTAHIDTLDVDVNATVAGTLGVTGVLTGTSLDISGDIDVDGTTNLDVVDIDGAVDMATTLAVAGNVDFNGDLDVDGTTNLDVVDIDGAVDMATTLAVAGNVDFNGDLDVDGTTNLDVVDIDGAVDMATTLTVGGEITAASLDISGNVDIDGTLETDALSINSTAVTSTAAELNILDGVTSTAAELNILDGVTSTATELNLLDGVTSTTAELNILDGVTASAADINLIDGITNGTVIASKAIVTDANIDITGGRNITISGELDAATLDISGNADIDGTLEADAITVNGTALASVIAGTTVANATTAAVATTVTITDNESTNENNAIIFTAGGDLDGGNLGLESDGDLKYNPSTGTLSATNISVSGTLSTVDSVTMSANNAVVFEGATADAHETTLTVVDATADRTITLPNVSGTVPVLAAASNTQITSTPEELNILDGVTSTAAELNILDGVTATATELNLIDGVTATTDELNILDGVTSTAAELNILDGVTSTAAELNALDGITAVVGELNALDIGSTAVGTAVASKAVILDSNKDYTGVRNLTISGELDAATLDISGNVDVDGVLETDNLTIGGAQGTDGQVLTSTGSGVGWEDAAAGFNPDAAVVFNESSADVDFRVESDNFTHALFVQGSDGNVGIGGVSAPAFENGNGLEIRNPTGNGGHLKLTDNASGTGATQGFDLYSFNTAAYIENYEAGAMVFRNNAAERMRINSSGNVGIGNTECSNRLHVEANGTGSIVGLRLANENTSAGDGAKINFTAGTSTEGAGIAGYGTALNKADMLFFAGGNVEQMRLFNTGELHITSGGAPIAPTIKHGGAVSDLAKLRLINRGGQAANKGGLLELGAVTDDAVSRSDVFGAVAGLKTNSTSANRAGYLQFSTSNGSSLTERMRLDSNGVLGVGRTPTGTNVGTIQAAGDIICTDNFGSLNSTAFIMVYTAGTDYEWQVQRSNGNTAMRLTEQENLLLGFGTADQVSTESKLQVAANSASGGVVQFIDPDVSVGAGNVILRLFFNADNDATNGVFTEFRDSVHQLGTITAASGTACAYNTSSDSRLKENIIDAPSQLDVVKNIKVREFDWKSNGYKEVGMIAQELNTVVPNVVNEGGEDEKENPWGVDYGKLTPYLIKAVQEQQTLIESLTARITTLEG